MIVRPHNLSRRLSIGRFFQTNLMQKQVKKKKKKKGNDEKIIFFLSNIFLGVKKTCGFGPEAIWMNKKA